jgi:hypothetical protein
MTIQEDAVLEALCEMTNIEPEKANSKIMKVTGKERKKLFQKFSMHQETEDLFNDENKMKEFMRLVIIRPIRSPIDAFRVLLIITIISET